jgi:integrase/recombinase XerC
VEACASSDDDRASFKGKRDYAILRLLWDNALRRGELVATNVGDLREGKLWIIGKGKTQQQSIWLRVLWRL